MVSPSSMPSKKFLYQGLFATFYVATKWYFYLKKTARSEYLYGILHEGNNKPSLLEWYENREMLHSFDGM